MNEIGTQNESGTQKEISIQNEIGDGTTKPIADGDATLAADVLVEDVSIDGMCGVY